MRIDLPTCGFKNCRYQFDGNCTNKKEYERCDYKAIQLELALGLKNQLQEEYDLEPMTRFFRD